MLGDYFLFVLVLPGRFASLYKQIIATSNKMNAKPTANTAKNIGIVSFLKYGGEQQPLGIKSVETYLFLKFYNIKNYRKKQVKFLLQYGDIYVTILW